MSKSVIISEGYSQVYLVPGISLVAISIPFLIFVPHIGVILLILAIILFLFKTGFEIYPEKKCCRGYKELLGLRMGSWKNLNGFSEVMMDFTHEADQDNLYCVMEAGSMFQATSYEIFAINSKGKLKLYEFVKYKPAWETLKAFREHMNFITHDEFELHRQKVNEKRRKFNS